MRSVALADDLQLKHLGLPAGHAELAPARLPSELSFQFEPAEHWFGEHEPDLAATAGPGGPGPPVDDPAL